MTECNRVTPFGEIVAIEQRGMFLGNRGSIHREHEILRPWQVRRWITCALTYKNWMAPMWERNRWTPLFFFDEAVAFAAGHRPCSLCRHGDFLRYMNAWALAFGERPLVDIVDRKLHAERVGVDRHKRSHVAQWNGLPKGVFAIFNDQPMLVLEDRLVPWSHSSDTYGPPVARPQIGTAEILTPPSTVEVFRHGYVPVIHEVPLRDAPLAER